MEKPTIYLREYKPSQMMPYEISTNEEGQKILEGIGLGKIAIIPNMCDDNLTIALL